MTTSSPMGQCYWVFHIGLLALSLPSVTSSTTNNNSTDFCNALLAARRRWWQIATSSSIVTSLQSWFHWSRSSWWLMVEILYDPCWTIELNFIQKDDIAGKTKLVSRVHCDCTKFTVQPTFLWINTCVHWTWPRIANLLDKWLPLDSQYS